MRELTHKFNRHIRARTRTVQRSLSDRATAVWPIKISDVYGSTPWILYGMNGKRLLFVDDEQSIRVTLSIILEQKGFDVSVAANVREAIQKINNHTFDALLSDLNIDQPGDGFAVVRAMRQVNPHCVVVILTGYPAFESAVEGIHQQVDDYLTKPADIETLVGVLKQKISERGSQPEGAS